MTSRRLASPWSSAFLTITHAGAVARLCHVQTITMAHWATADTSTPSSWTASLYLMSTPSPARPVSSKPSTRSLALGAASLYGTASEHESGHERPPHLSGGDAA